MRKNGGSITDLIRSDTVPGYSNNVKQLGTLMTDDGGYVPLTEEFCCPPQGSNNCTAHNYGTPAIGFLGDEHFLWPDHMAAPLNPPVPFPPYGGHFSSVGKSTFDEFGVLQPDNYEHGFVSYDGGQIGSGWGNGWFGTGLNKVVNGGIYRLAYNYHGFFTMGHELHFVHPCIGNILIPNHAQPGFENQFVWFHLSSNPAFEPQLAPDEDFINVPVKPQPGAPGIIGTELGHTSEIVPDFGHGETDPHGEGLGPPQEETYLVAPGTDKDTPYTGLETDPSGGGLGPPVIESPIHLDIGTGTSEIVPPASNYDKYGNWVGPIAPGTDKDTPYTGLETEPGGEHLDYIVGCKDPKSPSYNPSATIQCQPVHSCCQPYGSWYEWEAINSTNDCDWYTNPGQNLQSDDDDTPFCMPRYDYSNPPSCEQLCSMGGSAYNINWLGYGLNAYSYIPGEASPCGRLEYEFPIPNNYVTHEGTARGSRGGMVYWKAYNCHPKETSGWCGDSVGIPTYNYYGNYTCQYSGSPCAHFYSDKWFNNYNLNFDLPRLGGHQSSAIGYPKIYCCCGVT